MKKIFLILAVVLYLGINANAQTESDSTSSKFLLLIENTEDGIKITSSKGCAFKELTFSLKEGQIQEIDQFGIRCSDDEIVKDDNLTLFRFTIKKVEGGLSFEGIDGTTWKKLSFSCPINCSQLIDQNGMI